MHHTFDLHVAFPGYTAADVNNARIDLYNELRRWCRNYETLDTLVAALLREMESDIFNTEFVNVENEHLVE